MVRLATTAMRIAGTAAITENSPTMRTCSRAPAWPERRACRTFHTSRAMTPSSTSTVTALPASTLTTTRWVGTIGVSPIRMRNVARADSNAMTTAPGPMRPLASLRAGAAGTEATPVATSSTLVMNPRQSSTQVNAN